VKRQPKGAKERSQTIQVWTYEQAQAASPYIASILRSLREHALVESAISSNRIEGVEVEHKRIGTIVFGKAALRDRDEEEVRGLPDV